MRHPPIRPLISSQDVCGEGAAWHPASGAVFWTDINRGLLHRYLLQDGAFTTWQFDQPVTAVAGTTDDDVLLLVLGGSIVLWSICRESLISTLFKLPTWPAARCNDARVAPNGRLWFGTMENNVSKDGSSSAIRQWIGELYSLDSAGNAHSWLADFGIVNTVAWSPDAGVMYFADTLRNCIYRADFHATENRISNVSIFSSEFSRGLPDGSAVDREGYLWNCRFGGNCIVRFAPDGTIDHVIETPVANPTTCAFGGSDLRTLYLTSAGEDCKDRLLNGALLACEIDVPGLPVTPFQL